MASVNTSDQLERLKKLQDELDSSLHNLEADPGISLNKTLFTECRRWLIPSLDIAERGALAARASKCLEIIQSDPSPLVDLLEATISPFSFADILRIGGSVDFARGLGLNAHKSFHELFLFILMKATDDAGDAASVAMMPGVIHALIELWLLTPDVGVSSKSSEVLLSLLEIDKGPQLGRVDAYGNSAPSPGLVWKRVFGDNGIYSLIFGICSFKINVPALSTKERSTAQGRLLQIVPDLARIDWTYIVSSHHSDIEQSAGLQPEDEGFLDFVTRHMVDKGDVLMHITLLSTLCSLISTVWIPSITNTKCSSSVEYLIQSGLHDQTIALWLLPDSTSIDSSFLYHPASEYLSTYLLRYPEHFLGDRPKVKSILVHLSKNLNKSPSQWAQGSASLSDLLVLESLPRICLLPQRWLITEHQVSSPFLLLPSRSATPATLTTLGKILGAAPRPGPWNTSFSTQEKAAARVLYLLYITSYPTFFEDLTLHADTIALLPTAQAAIRMALVPLLEATWAPLTDTDQYDENQLPSTLDDLPSEEKLASLVSTSSLAPTGPDARYTGLSNILYPSVANKLVTWLLKPPKMFTNLIGGRGDTESAAYKIADAKFSALRRFQTLLAEDTDASTAGIKNELLPVLNARIAEGMWGSTSEVGGRIATLEL